MKMAQNRFSHQFFFFFFPYFRLFPNHLEIPKQSLHSLDSVFCSDKFREEKIDGFESFKHGFLVFLILTVSKNYKMTSKQFSFFKTKKTVSKFCWHCSHYEHIQSFRSYRSYTVRFVKFVKSYQINLMM